MRVNIIFLAAFLIFAESNAQTEPGRIRLDFPPEADPVLVGKLITENLLSRDYMLRADKTGIHYAEIITADGALSFATLTRDTSLYLQLEERYLCFLNTEECYLIPPGSHNRFTVALVAMGMYNWDKEQEYLDCLFTLVQDKWDNWKDPNPETGILKSARFWADDMYFTPTQETQIFKVDGDPSTIDRVTRWLTN